MKKFLLLLLLPIITVAQQFNGPLDDTIYGIPSDANITLYYSGIVGDENVPLNAVQINDKIIITIDVWNKLEGIYSATFAHIDMQYNKNALTLMSETYKTPNDAENNTWTQNAEFIPTSNYPEHSLWDQWQHGNGYQSSTDFITKHYQTQKLDYDFGSDQGTLIEIVFQVNELPEGADWSKIINLNMALVTDNTQSYNFPLVAAYPHQSLNLDPRPDVDLGGVTIGLEFGSNTDVTNFRYSVAYLQDSGEDFDGDGENDMVWYSDDVNETNGRPGTLFPANGIADITDKLIDPDKEWGIIIEWDYDKEEDFSVFFENVVTISDYLLLFKEIGQHGEGAINSGVSMQNADVASPYGVVDSNDAYKILAHVVGAEHLFENQFMGGPPDMNVDDQWFQALRIKTDDEYLTIGTNNFEVANRFGFLIPINVDFESENPQNFKFNGTWLGDVNLSHSAPVDASVANTAKSVMSYGETKKVVDNVTVDFVTEEVEGKVEATFTIPQTDLVGLQFVVKYDNSRLNFETAEFNVGNTSTNFANHHSPVIRIGSVNQDGSAIEAGTYKLIFNANNINGTTGLITVLATDGADSNADRVNIILN